MRINYLIDNTGAQSPVIKSAVLAFNLALRRKIVISRDFESILLIPENSIPNHQKNEIPTNINSLSTESIINWISEHSNDLFLKESIKNLENESLDLTLNIPEIRIKKYNIDARVWISKENFSIGIQVNDFNPEEIALDMDLINIFFSKPKVKNGEFELIVSPTRKLKFEIATQTLNLLLRAPRGSKLWHENHPLIKPLWDNYMTSKSKDDLSELTKNSKELLRKEMIEFPNDLHADIIVKKLLFQRGKK